MERSLDTAQSLPLTHPPRATQMQHWLQSLFTPSFCDLFFLAFIGWSFMASGTGWSRLLWDGDTSLHTAIGRWILDHGQVPVTDPFSFAQPGSPWLAVEWGSGVLFATLLQTFGLKGIVFLCGVLLAGLITILLRTMLSAGGDALFSILLALSASNALSLHYHARPHLFSLLFLAIAAWIVTVDRQRETRLLWLLPALTVLWVNLHPGFAVLFAYLGVVAVGSAIEWKLGNGSLAKTARYGWVLLACAAATLLNPFGWRLIAEVLSYFRASGMTDMIQEFQAPTFRSSPQLWFLVLLVAGVALCGLLLFQKRVVEPLLILGLAWASLTSVRHSTIFVVIVAPIIAGELSRYWRNWVDRQPQNSSARILDALSTEKRPAFTRNSAWVVVGLAAIFFLAPEGQWPTDFDHELFPVEIAARHPELAGARVFTSEQWADYLLLRNYPRQTDFYDDRSFYGEKMFRVAQNLLSGGAGWQATLDQYHTEIVLTPPQSPLSARLHESPAWSLVDHDKTAELFVHRAPAR
jgi:hypothetical protein